jgi:N-sulfoglucosamine sulfohydrolase
LQIGLETLLLYQSKDHHHIPINMKPFNRFVHCVTILIIPFTASLFTGCEKQPSRPPNILFAIADDWGWPHAGVYGDPVVQTPAFDRVAREGILCNHAYVSAPSCTPSRNAILTGQYHWRLGPGANLWSTLDTTIPVFPFLLEDAGYKIGHYRKSWGPGRLDGWKEHPVGKNYDEGGFEAFMAERTDDAPFFFWLGSWDPHRPYEEGTGIASGMDPEQIRLFGCFPDAPEVRSDVADYYYEVQRFDTLVADAIRLLEAYGELQNTIIVVTGDNGMPFPRCKANLYDCGTRMPLAIRWGSGIREPGRVLDDFVSLSDLAPTFLQLAGVEIPDVMTGKSMTRLFRSTKEGFVDKKNRDFVLHGKERHVPAQEGHMGGYPCRAIRTHDFLYIRNFEPDRWPTGTPDYRNAAIPYCWLGDCDNGPTKTCMVAHKDEDSIQFHLWELAFGKRPAEELYDCRKDPEQLVNVAYDPEYSGIREALSARLKEQLERTGDPRVLGGAEQFDAYPYYGSGPRHPSYQPEE